MIELMPGTELETSRPGVNEFKQVAGTNVEPDESPVFSVLGGRRAHPRVENCGDSKHNNAVNKR